MQVLSINEIQIVYMIYFYLVGKVFEVPRHPKCWELGLDFALKNWDFVYFQVIMWSIITNGIIWSQNFMPKTTNIQPKAIFFDLDTKRILYNYLIICDVKLT